MLKKHREVSPKVVSCKVITVSDTRDEQTDKSGQLMKQMLADNQHYLANYEIVKDEKTEIEAAISSGVQDEQMDAILINGGTGIAKRDVTIEVVDSFLDKKMPGFGEIFRMLSYQYDIGSAAILSRAIAGVTDNTVIFSVPGSSGAVKLAMEKLILPEIGHIVMELNKDN
ncbi:MogA/MoaB family molybdenum cofactor biosynthesis protein [Aquibacillus kalidii]|uniref:MogA/MoaB family molybdenum cofactor biosynthesis protein n=1 Tax=Aquibacillus kalidii TaxID=2762597 RepID=UPI00164666C7|nr:molybdenum cofactor biosynthesis protein B [Aquibacillus kalidii]